MAINLDDTTRCPVAEICKGCGTATGLAVVTMDSPVGVYCLTMCGTCVGAARFPVLRWASLFALVYLHCEHLGIDPDDMAAAHHDDRDPDERP